ncbi:MAG: hypothetical protein COA71_09410 [SAR86 cluster bacterium]|uniref:Flagellar motor switch protein FliM n=1 Tax=SAR86 cluster bacterium TaxID=2030880 RepID=A0A2A5CBC4_9GAMM|nr:MAG: hypothetical protein COA71_09410 [SAR86 cluster bacterium]
MGELLTENEIDALLHGVEGTDQEVEVTSSDEYELYNLSSGMLRVKSWQNEVDLIYERIQANLGIRLLGLLHKTVEVKRLSINIEKYGEYATSLDVPTSINVFSLKGMIGNLAIVLDAKLVYALVNIFFGGGSHRIDREGREFTEIEQRVIKLIVRTIIESIKLSWKELSDFEFILAETEMSPTHLKSFSEADVLMVKPFKIDFSGGGGEVHLLMPCAVIDSIFRKTRSKSRQGGIKTKEHMKNKALKYVVDVTGEISASSLTIGEVFNLAEGDIIPVESPEQLDVKINGIPKFKARMGDVKGKVGLKVTSVPAMEVL